LQLSGEKKMIDKIVKDYWDDVEAYDRLEYATELLHKWVYGKVPRDLCPISGDLPDHKCQQVCGKLWPFTQNIKVIVTLCPERSDEYDLVSTCPCNYLEWLDPKFINEKRYILINPAPLTFDEIMGVAKALLAEGERRLHESV